MPAIPHPPTGDSKLSIRLSLHALTAFNTAKSTASCPPLNFFRIQPAAEDRTKMKQRRRDVTIVGVRIPGGWGPRLGSGADNAGAVRARRLAVRGASDGARSWDARSGAVANGAGLAGRRVRSRLLGGH